MGTQRIPEKGTEPPFSANVYCGKTAGCIRIQLGTEVGLGRGHVLLDGDPALPLKGAHPLFTTMFIVAKRLDESRYCLVRRKASAKAYCVRGGPVPPKIGHSPQFSAHVYCGQTAGRIKMPLGTEVGLGPGHIVLDGDPAPPRQEGHRPPCSAHVCCGQTVVHFSYC